MTLYINTADDKNVVISIKRDDKVILEKKFEAKYSQAEKLLPEIHKLLKKSKNKLKDLNLIEVENTGGTFTSLRIGVLTANALAYGLGIPVKSTKQTENKYLKEHNLTEPFYDKEPNIT